MLSDLIFFLETYDITTIRASLGKTDFCICVQFCKKKLSSVLKLLLDYNQY